MNLAQLEYFEAVYARRSYATAAKDIPMSHQGLLKSMVALQGELGVPLFCTAEGSSTVTPTSYAEAFHAFAVDVQARQSVLETEFERISRAGNTIRLGASTGVLGMLGISFLGTFREGNPRLDVIEEEVADLRCDAGLANGEFDLALTVFPYDEAFETRPLYEMDRYVWVPRTDRLAKAECVRIEDLAGRHVGVMGPTFKNYGAFSTLLPPTVWSSPPWTPPPRCSGSADTRTMQVAWPFPPSTWRACSTRTARLWHVASRGCPGVLASRGAKAVRCLSRKRHWSRTARCTPDASRAAESRGSSRGRGASGYLTIRGYEERGRRRSYTLGFPNHEVEDGFNARLADAYTKDAAA